METHCGFWRNEAVEENDDQRIDGSTDDVDEDEGRGKEEEEAEGAVAECVHKCRSNKTLLWRWKRKHET